MHSHRAARPFRESRLMEMIRLEARFAREFVISPFNVGSVCPSSRALTQTLVSMADISREGLVIDLGAGSGIVTRELLHAGVAPERILGVEISGGFKTAFERQCPGVTMITGDARNLGLLLNEYAPGKPICSILSSLPFRVMPGSVVRAITREMHSVLAERGGSLVQYTYAWWISYPLRKFGFMPGAARLVLKNVPPARVERYTVQEGRAQ